MSNTPESQYAPRKSLRVDGHRRHRSDRTRYPVRVAHVSTAHNYRDVRIFEKECTTLARVGYDVWWVVPGAPETSINNIHLRSIAISRRGRAPARYLHRLIEAYKSASAIDADIYHIHDPELILLGFALRFRGASIIYDAHEDAPLEALSLNRHRRAKGYLLASIWWLLTLLAKYSFSGLIAATPSIAAKLRPGRVDVVRNYPRLERFRSADRALERDPYRLVYMGNISEIRGIREMLDALDILSAKFPCRLRLAGQFASGELLTFAKSHRAWSQVDYLGYLRWDDVIHEMQRSSIGLLLLHPTPDHIECIPTKLFEYMAAGLAIVCPDFPLLREIISGADCGWVVNPLDVHEIASALEYLLANPERTLTQGANGKRAVERLYSWENEAKTLLSVYEHVADQRPTRPSTTHTCPASYD